MNILQGRTRRSEIEELMIWRVRDPKKPTPTSSSPIADVGPIERQQDLEYHPAASSPPPSLPPSSISYSDSFPHLAPSDTVPFAEAMGERIKRRRQMRGGKIKIDDDSDDQKPSPLPATPGKTSATGPAIKKESAPPPSIPKSNVNIQQQIMKHVSESDESDTDDRVSNSSDFSSQSKIVKRNRQRVRCHKRVIKHKLSDSQSSLESSPIPSNVQLDAKNDIKKAYNDGESSSSLSDSSMPDVHPIDVRELLAGGSDHHYPPKLDHMHVNIFNIFPNSIFKDEPCLLGLTI